MNNDGSSAIDSCAGNLMPELQQ
uniref:Uncharacterized protein n=1 Tax=Arundo donax TaxID=35708 RepID=A0A0A9G7M3_ARUDO